MKPGRVSGTVFNMDTAKTILKLLAISMAVGWLMSFFGIGPMEILENLGETVQKIYALVTGFVSSVIDYVLMGAVVVVPVWAVFNLPGLMKKKNRGE